MKPMPQVTILTDSNTKKILGQPGQAKGLPTQIQDSLVKKLADVEGKVEPKGRGFYGIDLGQGHRAIFTLNDQQAPVMVYVGTHKGYEAVSGEITKNPEAARSCFLERDQVETTLSSKKIAADVSKEGFASSFLKTIGIEARSGAAIKAASHLGMAGKVAAAGAAVVMAAEGASAAEMADLVVPGINEASKGHICYAFADAAGAVTGISAGTAVTIVTSPALTPVGGAVAGIAAGTSVETFTSSVLKGACNFFNM